MQLKKKIRVLVVDDSAVVRQTLALMISEDPVLELMATASDPYVAAKKMLEEVPDVITLDVEMPRMDGLTFLRRIMTQHPIPVVIISSLTSEGTETAMKALEYGAVEIITKPQMDTKTFFQESAIRICDAIKAAAHARLKRRGQISTLTIKVEPKYSADAVIPALKSGSSMLKTTEKVIAVGASTGGTEALARFLQVLPPDSPGIVIVQHMPEGFTRSFAERLNGLCAISVKEAENNDTVIRGRALIAPGHKHTLLKRSGARYYVEVTEGPLVNRHRPSVDVLFRSVAMNAGANAVGVIMTGMGADGAKGLLEMKNAGAHTIAQDEQSCVVFGMPHEAIKLEAHTQILSLEFIAAAALKKGH
ncbi:MAG: chemotaxis response regulator protein-glutamate methylesterase [Spirochaetales bacterium]|jgi:two-component system chemotaxis response regulator CheB|nr:chemotaxis response regulator protein-glutamate methylesterase [Spirochaetales bacterium]